MFSMIGYIRLDAMCEPTSTPTGRGTVHLTKTAGSSAAGTLTMIGEPIAVSRAFDLPRRTGRDRAKLALKTHWLSNNSRAERGAMRPSRALRRAQVSTTRALAIGCFARRGRLSSRDTKERSPFFGIAVSSITSTASLPRTSPSAC